MKEELQLGRKRKREAEDKLQSLQLKINSVKVMKCGHFLYACFRKICYGPKYSVMLMSVGSLLFVETAYGCR